MSFNILVTVALGYVLLLFAVAFIAEWRAKAGYSNWLSSPWVYTLSLSVYCSAWTFYGAVGYAARSGLEFATIYLGPTLVLVGWWWILRRLVRIGQAQRITSVADLISSRFGKSAPLGAIVTIISVIAGAPYIALQLQSITLSLSVFAQNAGTVWDWSDFVTSGFWVSVGLAAFTVFFGTRNLDANDRHHGVVVAIALEALVKLVALTAVGAFVVWGIADGPSEMLTKIEESNIVLWNQQGGRWISLIFLSGAAILCLPRMFHVMVVENHDERHLHTASWAFPLYLLMMSLFTVPIAAIGLELLPEGSNPDLFVLTIPLAEKQAALAVLAFLGGFSAATSMVILSTIAIAIMVSNHIVIPMWLSRQSGQAASISGDVRRVTLLARRMSIVGILALGFLYYRMSGGGTALAAIGLVSFTGAVQILPVLLGGIFWRNSTNIGAMAGLVTGLVVWSWSLFLPGLDIDSLIGPATLADGPFGIAWLRPQALFGVTGMDPLMHGIMWSVLLNAIVFVTVSLLTTASPLERVQSADFVNIMQRPARASVWATSANNAEDLLVMTQRIMGSDTALALFKDEAARQGKSGFLPEVTSDFIERLERIFAGSVGSATAHAMITQLVGAQAISVEDLVAVADETAQILQYSNRLEAKSIEQEQTAQALRAANDKLTALSVQKDAFLSQISHELRTPMTSIRSFSEILRDFDLSEDEQKHYAGVIQDETIRLTRLLDDLLDLSVLESGTVVLVEQEARLADLIERAIHASETKDRVIEIAVVNGDEMPTITTDADRLTQVFINLITNAHKYCDATAPELNIIGGQDYDGYYIDFIDNGSGIAAQNHEIIFEKFSRVADSSEAGGTGLGLAICREVMHRLGGDIAYLPHPSGGAFRVRIATDRPAN